MHRHWIASIPPEKRFSIGFHSYNFLQTARTIFVFLIHQPSTEKYPAKYFDSYYSQVSHAPSVKNRQACK
jgi:hypothetical protein